MECKPFAWNNVVFMTQVKKSQLFLKWREIDGSSSQARLSLRESQKRHKKIKKHLELSKNTEQQLRENEGLLDLELDLYNSSPDVDILQTNDNEHDAEMSGNDDMMTSLTFHHCKIIHHSMLGFSYNQESFQSVPVLLIVCHKNSKQAMKSVPKQPKHGSREVEYVLVSIKKITKKIESSLSSSSEFELIIVRSFAVDNPGEVSTEKITHKMCLILDFQLLLLCSNPESVWFKLLSYSSDSDTGQQIIQDFNTVTSSSEMISEVTLLDTYCDVEEENILALISFKQNGDMKCLSLQFYLGSNISEPASLPAKYEMRNVPLDRLFSPDFTQIMKNVKISSFSCKYNKITKSLSVLCTEIMMLTHTGYILRFVDGHMQNCVGLGDCLFQCVSAVDEGIENSDTQFISFTGNHNKVALQVNSTCLLLDWGAEKVTKTWSSVSVVGSCDVHLCGIPSLLLILHPENLESVSESWYQPLDKAKLVVVDVDDEPVEDNRNVDDSDDDGGGNGAKEMDTHHNKIMQPLCAVNALLAQHKRCQSALREAESSLSSKLSFLSETWQQLSQLSIDETISTADVRRSSKLPPLVCLVQGSIPESMKDKDTKEHCHINVQQPQSRFLQKGDLWMKTVESAVVVGMSVKNISHKPIRDIVMTVVPSASCLGNIIRSTSHTGQQEMPTSGLAEPQCTTPGSYSSKRRKVAHTASSNTYLVENCRTFNLTPGESTMIASSVDISESIGADDLKFHAFVGFTVLMVDVDDVISEQEKKVQPTVKVVEEYCTDVILTSQDIVSEKFRVSTQLDRWKANSEHSLTLHDLLALDCVQTCWTLAVHSVISSVSCMRQKLTICPLVKHLEWAEQFIVMASDSVRFCRVQILEQSSKHKGMIQIFAKSKSQALLLVQFLYSILPEDFTIIPPPSSQSAERKQAMQTAMQQVEDNISKVKQQITMVTSSSSPRRENANVFDKGDAASPQFHSTKFRKANSTRDKTIKAEIVSSVTKERAGCSKDCKEEQDIVLMETEMAEVRKARKRLRERWGEGDAEVATDKEQAS